jgi:hypothetical protein
MVRDEAAAEYPADTQRCAVTFVSRIVVCIPIFVEVPVVFGSEIANPAFVVVHP